MPRQSFPVSLYSLARRPYFVQDPHLESRTQAHPRRTQRPTNGHPPVLHELVPSPPRRTARPHARRPHVPHLRLNVRPPLRTRVDTPLRTSGLQSVSPFSTVHCHSFPRHHPSIAPTRIACSPHTTCQATPFSHTRTASCPHPLSRSTPSTSSQPTQQLHTIRNDVWLFFLYAELGRLLASPKLDDSRVSQRSQHRHS